MANASNAPTSGPHRLEALLNYCSVASMALWMWLLHPSMSFLAINCCAVSISFVAVVFASPLPHGLNVSSYGVDGRVVTLCVMSLMAESQREWNSCKASNKEQEK